MATLPRHSVVALTPQLGRRCRTAAIRTLNPQPSDHVAWLDSSAASYDWTPPDKWWEDERCRHILVINDSREMRDFCCDLLEEEGYRVSVTPSPPQDLAAITRLAPDLILLDVLFGARPVGLSLLQRLRQDPRTAPIPIVICSAALDTIRDLSPYLHAQAIPVLIKPFELADLLTAITASWPNR